MLGCLALGFFCFVIYLEFIDQLGMTVIVSCRQTPKLRNHAANNVPGQSVLLCYVIFRYYIL